MKELMVVMLVMPQLTSQDARLTNLNIVILTLKSFGNEFGVPVNASSQSFRKAKVRAKIKERVASSRGMLTVCFKSVTFSILASA